MNEVSSTTPAATYPCELQQVSHRPWCTEHLGPDVDDEFVSECSTEVVVVTSGTTLAARGVSLTVSQGPDQDEPMILLEANGAHLSPAVAQLLHSELGLLLGRLGVTEY